jgi:hypothetical protein
MVSRVRFSQLPAMLLHHPSNMAGKKSERESIDDVTKRLKKKYPNLSSKHIEKVVEDTYGTFQHAKLRDYIAVLVEHGAKSALQGEKRKGK